MWTLVVLPGKGIAVERKQIHSLGELRKAGPHPLLIDFWDISRVPISH